MKYRYNGQYTHLLLLKPNFHDKYLILQIRNLSKPNAISSITTNQFIYILNLMNNAVSYISMASALTNKKNIINYLH